MHTRREMFMKKVLFERKGGSIEENIYSCAALNNIINNEER